jgi:uncharacterized protein (DUF488 family)
MELFTIGFAGKSAEVFFTSLVKHGVKKVIDIRLNNVSQLAGFTRKNDLKYFLKVIAGIEYEYVPLLAATKELMDGFRGGKNSWEEFEAAYLDLLEERQVLAKLKPEDFDKACLLCSEEKPDHCHRRLAAEWLQRKWEGVKIIHIM